MAAKHCILCLDETVYELRGAAAREIQGVRGLRGDKMVFDDFEAAVPRVATVDAGVRFAHAVLEKQLRESGEIEPDGRLIVLLKRRRGQRTTEMLYITAPPGAGLENELERDAGGEYLLYPVQLLFVQALERLKPRKPAAVLLIGERHIDVVVADRRVVYGAFRVSVLKAGSRQALLEKNLGAALQGVEREFNIDIAAMHCLHLFSRVEAGYDWLEARAKARGMGFSQPPVRDLLIDGASRRCSVLPLLRRVRPASSCSPAAAINDFRANAALPWTAAAMAACCAAALFFIIERHEQGERLAARMSVLSSAVNARLGEPPAPVPAYEDYLSTAQSLVYARSIPTLRQVLGDVSRAAGSRATILDRIELEYTDDRVIVHLAGRTEKGPDSDDRLAIYNRLIADLQGTGYDLAASELDTEPQHISFTLSLERRVNGVRS